MLAENDRLGTAADSRVGKGRCVRDLGHCVCADVWSTSQGSLDMQGDDELETAEDVKVRMTPVGLSWTCCSGVNVKL